MIVHRTLLFNLAFAFIIESAIPVLAQTVSPAVPYDLKGDQLGMSITDFKTKYYHMPDGDPKPAPFCSDDYPLGKVGGDLAKNVHGVVACKIFFPFEEQHGTKTTIANVPVRYQVFYFVDGKLFKIEIIFDAKDFGVVRTAFEDKYHAPSTSETKTYQNGFGATFEGKDIIWQNDASIIIMKQFGVDVTQSTVVFLHTALTKEVESRIPKPKPDL